MKLTWTGAGKNLKPSVPTGRDGNIGKSFKAKIFGESVAKLFKR